MIINPEWLSTLESQLKEYPKRTTYAFASLSPDGKPKVRHVIHRGITPSGLLLTTTDTRMQKPNHLSHDPTVELAWWIEESAVQFRITGKAYTLDDNKETVAAAIAKMGLTGEDSKPEWWEQRRNDAWTKEMSGHLRGSFGRPQPGKKISEIPEKPEEWLTKLDAESDDPKQKKDIEFALSHFAIIAIQCDAAELLELKPVPNKRTQWNKQSDGTWETVQVAP